MRKLLLSLLFVGGLAAQGLDNVTFSVQQLFFAEEPLTNFLLGNFGLEGKDAGTEVFRATVTNSGSTAVSGLYVHIDFIIESYSAAPVYSSRSDAFSVPANSSLTFSSIDYFNEQNDGVHWGRTFTANAAATKESELQKLLDAGGRLPSGNVKIRLILSQDGHQNPSVFIAPPDDIEYEIVNINELHLVSPGVPADAYDPDLATILTSTPQFSWISDLLGVQYDAASALGDNRFRLEIFEIPDIAQVDAVINSGVTVHSVDLEPSIYTYPPDAAELRPGQLYAWRVRALLKSAALAQYDDTQMITAPFLFSVANMDDGEGGMSAEAARIAGLLRVLLGDDFSYILKAVEGMEPEQITFNNSDMTMEALADTLYSLTGQGFMIEQIGVTNE